jgi:hypothetical protein
VDAYAFQITTPLQAITWQGYDADAAVRLVLLAREETPERPMELIMLPAGHGGRSYLAALADSENRVVEWLELSVQDPAALLESPATRCGVINNLLLDAEFTRWVEVTRELNPSDLVAAPWQKQAPMAWAIDPVQRALQPLVHPHSRRPWTLCQDDARLAAAGLPAYRSSTERWFRAEAADGADAWITSAQLQSAAGSATHALLLGGGPWIPFNLWGGQMVLRRNRPIALERFAQWLLPAATKDVAAARPSLEEDPVAYIEEGVLARWQSAVAAQPSLFESEPVLESLFLGLSLWHHVVQTTFETSRRLNRPFLNLTAASFRVTLPAPNPLIPLRWNHQLALVRPSEATALADEAKQAPRFVPYRGVWDEATQDPFGGWRVGSGTVRLSQVAEGDHGQVRLEGFIDGPDLRQADPDAVIWVSLALDGQSFTFIAHLSAEQNRRTGVRFAADTKELSPAARNALRTAGEPRRPCQFCLLHPISPTFDVHALGRIGLKIFFPNPAEPVAEIEDDLFELASFLPQRWNLEHFRFLADNPDINPRLRRLLTPHAWLPAEVSASAVTRELWHALIRELMEFVTVEEQPVDPGSDDADWLAVLRRRHAALSALALHVRGLLTAPRPAHEDIARVVQRFARATPAATGTSSG